MTPTPKEETMTYRPTLAEYDFGEVASAIQKSIRRGLEEDAMFWSIVMEERFPWYLWKRLKVVAFEDCGSPEVIGHVMDCARFYEEYRKEREKKGRGLKDERLALASAILEMCRCKKNRLNDDFQAVLYHRYEKQGWRLEIPEYAVDKHTDRGRSKGKTEADFLREGSMLANEDTSVHNPYRAEWQKRVLADSQTRLLP